jgi:hypothetical protein
MNRMIYSRQPTSMMDYMRNNPYTRQLALRDSPIMLQADPRAQRRMMENVAKGLPADVDPQRVFRTFADPSMPQYGTFLGASGGFGGGWGQVGLPQTGSTKSERDAARRGGDSGETEIARREAPEGYVRNRFGYSEPKGWYNEDGTKMTESEYRKSKMKKYGQAMQPAPSMPAQNDSWKFSLLGGGPMLNWPYPNV